MPNAECRVTLIPNPTPYTLNPKPYTLIPAPITLNPTPHTYAVIFLQLHYTALIFRQPNLYH